MPEPFNPFVPRGDPPPEEARARPFVPDWISPAAEPSPTEGRPIVISGADCVIPGHGILRADVRVEGSVIKALGLGLAQSDCEVIQADGKLVIPGIVDPHIHLGLFAAFDTEAFTETRSAVLNGVTTLGLFLGAAGSYLPVLDSALRHIRERALADLFIHLAIFNEQQLDEIPVYAARYGIRSFKAYLAGIPGLIPSLDEGFLLDLMAAVAALGPDAVLCIHAENWRIVDWATARLQQAHAGISLEQWSDTHPGFSEAEAIHRAVLLAEQSGVSVYIVHLSSVEGLEMVRRLRREGRRFHVETTSPYLTLTYDTPLGALAKMVPPVRSTRDRDALWTGLRDNLIDTIGTDHTPMTKAEKRPDPGIWKTMPGYPAVGTHLPSLLDGARRRTYPLVTLIEKMTANPARIFGLYPRKGTILPGSDADLVVVDPAREQTVSSETAASRADYALHEGERLVGWPDAVFKSGRRISAADLAHDVVTARGTYLPRR